MSKTTAVNKIPYPEDTDAPDGPTQIKALAELLDTLKWGSRNLAPTVGAIDQASPVSLEGSYVDLSSTSTELKPAVESRLLVAAMFVCAEVVTGGEIVGSLRVDSSDQVGISVVNTLGIGSTLIFAPTLAAGTHTIKLRAKRSAGSGGKVTGRMLYLMFAS